MGGTVTESGEEEKGDRWHAGESIRRSAERPRILCGTRFSGGTTRQIGYQWAYIFSAVRPDTGDDVTLVMPSVNAKVMDLFLAHFADTLDQDAHAVMMCDGDGRHDERALTVPDNVTLALLPPYSPELNPVERVWLYLRERFLSLRVLDDTEAIIDACCQAWIDLIAEPDRMRTLCAYPWIMKVIS